jgi:hypothetical protein
MELSAIAEILPGQQPKGQDVAMAGTGQEGSSAGANLQHDAPRDVKHEGLLVQAKVPATGEVCFNACQPQH